MSSSRTVRRCVALTLAALLVGGSCGVDTSSDGGGLSPTTTETPAKAVTVEDLEAILPEATDIGAAYRTVSDDGDDDGPDPVQDAIDEQCPDMVAYQDDADDVEASRLFEGSRGRQISVSLKPSAKVRTDADLAAYIDAVNDCDSVEASDAGVDYELTYAARKSPTSASRRRG